MTKALKNIRNALKMDMNQSFFLHLLALILSSQKKVSYEFSQLIVMHMIPVSCGNLVLHENNNPAVDDFRYSHHLSAW